MTGPRVVPDPAEKPIKVCAGCGGEYQQEVEAQVRCGRCIGTLQSSLGALTTPAVLALIGQHQDDPSDLKEAVTINQVVERLNELLVLDPRAISALVRNRVRVNAGIVNHPTAKTSREGDDQFYLGIIGLLNAVFGQKSGDGAIGLRQSSGGVGHVLGFVRMDELPPDPQNNPS